MNDSILITDFDGTLTDHDFYILVRDRYMPPGTRDYWADYFAGRITHFEAMQAFLSHTPTDQSSIDQLLTDVHIDPGFALGVQRLREAGWDVAVASAGSSWYIDPILARAGVDLPVFANGGHMDGAFVLDLPLNSPYFSLQTGIDKSAVVRHAQAKYERVAFAGDGPPDIPPALLVEPELRFARGYLAEELSRHGERFVPIDRWFDIVPYLERLAAHPHPIP